VTSGALGVRHRQMLGPRLMAANALVDQPAEHRSAAVSEGMAPPTTHGIRCRRPVSIVGEAEVGGRSRARGSPGDPGLDHAVVAGCAAGRGGPEGRAGLGRTHVAGSAAARKEREVDGVIERGRLRSRVAEPGAEPRQQDGKAQPQQANPPLRHQRYPRLRVAGGRRTRSALVPKRRLIRPATRN